PDEDRDHRHGRTARLVVAVPAVPVGLRRRDHWPGRGLRVRQPDGAGLLRVQSGTRFRGHPAARPRGREAAAGDPGPAAHRVQPAGWRTLRGGPVMAAKPVIVGTDGSEESLRAVEWAALEARRHASPLRIVSAPAVMPRLHAYHVSPA